jgi:Zn-dependent protease with chaperone function
VSDSLEQLPDKDLRAAAKLNAFNFVAAAPRHRWWYGIPLLTRVIATHPPLRARLDALSALEHAQQTRRA